MNNNFQPYKQSSLKTDLFFLVSSLVNNNLLLLVASFLAFLSFGEFGRGGELFWWDGIMGISEYIESGRGNWDEWMTSSSFSRLYTLDRPTNGNKGGCVLRSGASLNTSSTNCIGKSCDIATFVVSFNAAALPDRKYTKISWKSINQPMQWYSRAGVFCQMILFHFTSGPTLIWYLKL